MKPKLSWEPVLDGDIYCAPACGGKCRYEDFLRASRKAEALCARLGRKWKPVVHENLGWHYRAEIPGDIRIHITPPYGDARRDEEPDRYTAYVHRTYVATDANPAEALAKAIELAREERRQLTTIIATIEDVFR